jgi:SAM-dependent MidA family methyltransferase
MATSDLPLPDALARQHSDRVVAHVCAAIAAAGGFLPFDRYMHEVLYARGLGYYAAGAAKLGPGGDFTTAPEMTPLFAAAIATQVDAILAATRAREVIELGGGSGRLAAGLLDALASRGALPSRYAILDVSPELRDRQRATIGRDARAHVERVTWIDRLPDSIDGCVIANEVLDAIPVHVVARRGGVWYERGVGCDGASGRPGWSERPLVHERLLALAAERFPIDGDYTSELNLAAEALVEHIGRRMVAGAALFIDYGFPASEYYHPQRSEGTLMGHYRHRAHADPFLWPGLSDLTAHVDFTAIANAGVRAGLAVAGFASQAAFLIGCGILDALAALGDPRSLAYVREAAALQRLLSPAEMGEFFKSIALARSDGIAWPGFGPSNRAHRL